MAMPGGLKAAVDVDEAVRGVILGAKADIEAKAGATYETFEPVKVSTQVVAGTNYFCKINVGDSFIHARVYRDLSQNVSVAAVQTGKQESDPIEYFQ
jgi:cystatin-A/B